MISRMKTFLSDLFALSPTIIPVVNGHPVVAMVTLTLLIIFRTMEIKGVNPGELVSRTLERLER